MRPNGLAAQSRLICPLVLAWTGQNILLCDLVHLPARPLYIATFSLTCLRFAAWIRMGLVATGLVLMLIQIGLGASPILALVNANAAISLAAVLYADVAGYPTMRRNWSRPIMWDSIAAKSAGSGTDLDLKYLESVGPQVSSLSFADRISEGRFMAPFANRVITLTAGRRDNGFSCEITENWQAMELWTWRI